MMRTIQHGTVQRSSNKSSPKCRVSRGFTLVELLVVISIIALLISILLPSLRSARDQAKLVKCLAHERGMAQGGLSFAVDHNDRFQLVTNGAGVDEADPSNNKYAYGADRELLTWPVAIAQSSGMTIANNWEWGVRADSATQALAREEYMAEGFENFICPADRVQIASTFYARGTGNGMLQGAGNPRISEDDTIGNDTSYWGRLSYGINEDLVGAEVGLGTGGAVGKWIEIGGTWGWAAGEQHPQAGERLQGQLNKIFDPATVVMLTDAGANTEDELLSANTTDARGTASLINLLITAKMQLPVGNRDQLGRFMQTWVNRVPYKRHPKGSLGIVYADFHAETQRPTKWEKNNYTGKELPSEYSGVNRLSPYRVKWNR